MQTRSSFLYSPITLVVIFFIVLSIALGVSRISHSSTASDEAPLPLLVETLGDDQNAFQPAFEHYIARVEAAQRVELGFDIASELTQIYKKEGQSFKAGELLAELDTRRLESRHAELMASKDRAVAMLELAKTSLKRVEGLRKNRNVSEQALDESLRQREAAEADLSLVKAQISSIELEIEKSKLFAPFDGVVVDRLSDVGRTVSLGLPVLLIEQISRPDIRVSLPLEVARTLEADQPIRLRYQGAVLSGTVDRINLSLSTARSSEVYLSTDETGIALVPGEILQVELDATEEQRGVWLPLSALAEYGRGLWSVYLAKPSAKSDSVEQSEDHAVIVRTVVAIERVRGEFALVRGGLKAKDRPYVVSEATHRVVAGQRVRTKQQVAFAGVH